MMPQCMTLGWVQIQLTCYNTSSGSALASASAQTGLGFVSPHLLLRLCPDTRLYFCCTSVHGPQSTVRPRPSPTFVDSISNFNSNQIGSCGARSNKQLFDFQAPLGKCIFPHSINKRFRVQIRIRCRLRWQTCIANWHLHWPRNTTTNRDGNCQAKVMNFLATPEWKLIIKCQLLNGLAEAGEAEYTDAGKARI